MKRMPIYVVLSIFTVFLSLFINSCEKDKPEIPIINDTTPDVNYNHHTEWSYNLVMYEVNIRQYTSEGTISAFETHLNRLKDMGVGILWIMPVHPIGVENRLGSLGSYYSVQNFKSINPDLGTMTDFKRMVNTAHDLGMFVIMDWVANHTSWDNILTSTNPDYYVTNSSGDFIPPPGTNWSDVIELNYNNYDLREYMIDALKYWIDEAKVDGFRFDYVEGVPGNFWTAAMDSLNAHKPGVFNLAEGQNTVYATWGFDMDFDWTLYGWGSGLMLRIYNGTATLTDLENHMNANNSTYPESFYRILFTSDHDENSWEGTEFQQLGSSAEVFAVLTLTLDGMPLIYSGQEAGNTKQLAFFDKDEISWSSFPYENMYKTLLTLKKDNSALWNGTAGGDPVRITTSDDTHIYAFMRTKDSDKVLVLLNLSDTDSSFEISDASANDIYTDVFTESTVTIDNTTTYSLDAWSYMVLEINN